MFSPKEQILRGSELQQAQSKFDPEVRAKYLNASEADTCIRKQWYAKNGAQTDGPEDWGFAQRGHMIEAWAVDMMRLANTPMAYEGPGQVGLRSPESRLSATPDGLIDCGDHWIYVEFKSFDPRANTSAFPKPKHITQCRIGMYLFEEAAPDLLEDKPIRHAVLVYINASNVHDIHEFEVSKKSSDVKRWIARADRILDCTDPASLPREGKEEGGKECRQECAFTKICGVDGASHTPSASASSNSATARLRAYQRAHAAEAEAKEAKAAAAEQLKAELRALGRDHAVIDGVKVSLSTRAGSVSYAKLVKDHLPGADLDAYRGKSTEILKVG